MTRRTRWLLIIVLILVLLTVPGVLRVYSIAGPSDAPTLVIGDRVLVNRAAYDAVLPYLHLRLFSWGDPGRGEMVILRPPQRDDVTATKRVVGVPGDRIEMRGHRLWVNGEPLRYERLDPAEFAWIPGENSMGPVVERERGSGIDHTITRRSDGGAPASFGPVDLGEDEYFVLGDNRTDSRDSRDYGPVPRDRIQGKVLGLLAPGPERP